MTRRVRFTVTAPIRTLAREKKMAVKAQTRAVTSAAVSPILGMMGASHPPGEVGGPSQ